MLQFPWSINYHAFQWFSEIEIPWSPHQIPHSRSWIFQILLKIELYLFLGRSSQIASCHTIATDYIELWNIHIIIINFHITIINLLMYSKQNSWDEILKHNTFLLFHFMQLKLTKYEESLMQKNILFPTNFRLF